MLQLQIKINHKETLINSKISQANVRKALFYAKRFPEKAIKKFKAESFL